MSFSNSYIMSRCTPEQHNRKSKRVQRERLEFRLEYLGDIGDVSGLCNRQAYEQNDWRWLENRCCTSATLEILSCTYKEERGNAKRKERERLQKTEIQRKA